MHTYTRRRGPEFGPLQIHVDPDTDITIWGPCKTYEDTHTHADSHRRWQFGHRICTEFDRCVLQCGHRFPLFLQLCRLLKARGRFMLQRQRSCQNLHVETTLAHEVQRLGIVLSCQTRMRRAVTQQTQRGTTQGTMKIDDYTTRHRATEVHRSTYAQPPKEQLQNIILVFQTATYLGAGAKGHFGGCFAGEGHSSGYGAQRLESQSFAQGFQWLQRVASGILWHCAGNPVAAARSV